MAIEVSGLTKCDCNAPVLGEIPYKCVRFGSLAYQISYMESSAERIFNNLPLAPCLHNPKVGHRALFSFGALPHPGDSPPHFGRHLPQWGFFISVIGG